MVWYVTSVETKELLESELNRLQTAGHTIFSVFTGTGKILIVSKV